MRVRKRLKERICAKRVRRVKKILTVKKTMIIGIDRTELLSQQKKDSIFIDIAYEEIKFLFFQYYLVYKNHAFKLGVVNLFFRGGLWDFS